MASRIIDLGPNSEVATPSDLKSKQDALSNAQKAAVDSGIDAEKVAAYDGYAREIRQKAGIDDLPYKLHEVSLQDARLLDRASNIVTPSDDSALTLTLPPAVPGYMRDLIVRLDLTAPVAVPEITFAAPTGETATFETEDGAMPELEAGNVNLVALTETAAGKFDVAHKVMQEVA